MKQNSPYTATITGCGFLYYEFLRILPLLMSEDSAKLLKEEIDNSKIENIISPELQVQVAADFNQENETSSSEFDNLDLDNIEEYSN